MLKLFLFVIACALAAGFLVLDAIAHFWVIITAAVAAVLVVKALMARGRAGEDAR